LGLLSLLVCGSHGLKIRLLLGGGALYAGSGLGRHLLQAAAVAGVPPLAGLHLLPLQTLYLFPV
jgi:hypothetical protein